MNNAKQKKSDELSDKWFSTIFLPHENYGRGKVQEIELTCTPGGIFEQLYPDTPCVTVPILFQERTKHILIFPYLQDKSVMSLQMYYPEDDSFFEFLANKNADVVALWYYDTLLKKKSKNVAFFNHATQIFREAEKKVGLSNIIDEYALKPTSLQSYKRRLAA